MVTHSHKPSTDFVVHVIDLKAALTFTQSLNTMSPEDIDRVIEMAWEDRTPFDAIEMQFGLTEKEVIELMRDTRFEAQPASNQNERDVVVAVTISFA